MKKLIIRTREEQLTPNMMLFGYSCANSFLKDLNKNIYGKDWHSCAYVNDAEGLSCYAELNKTGTVSVCVFREDAK